MVGETDAATQKGASQYLIFDKFKGMNTQAARWGLPDDEQAWLENLQPIALNKAFGVPAPATSIYTLTGETIVRQFGNIVIGSTMYMVHFCASGAAYATPLVGQGPNFPVTGTVAIKFAPAGTFSPTGGDAVELNAQRLLIADTVSGYSTWDGNVFVRQGGVSPNLVVTAGGTGYVGGATAVISGGSGTGATASVQTNAAGVVIGLTLTNAGTGYLPSDTLTVTITGISGGTGATANAHVWPFLTPFPSTIAVAFGRVWLASGRVLIVSGVGSATFGAGYDDFSSADASVTTTIQDNDLTTQITALRFLNNYLYILGDNSVKSIGGISVTASVTNFSIVTLSSDQGTTFLQSVISFNRLITFANTVGVYGVFGASVEKLSGPMDGIFALADFTQPLQAAVNDLNDIHTYMLLIRYRDPLAPGERSILLGYMNSKWFVMSQGNSLSTIATMVLGGITETFGSSGSDVTQLLQNTSAAVPFKVSTSLSPHGNPVFGKRIIRAFLATTASACADLDVIAESEQGQVDTEMPHTYRPLQFVNNSGQLLTFVNNSQQVITFAAYAFTAPRTGLFSWSGRWIGLTATGTINRQQLHLLGLEYQSDPVLTDRGLLLCTPAPPSPPPPPPGPPPPPPPPPSGSVKMIAIGAGGASWAIPHSGMGNGALIGAGGGNCAVRTLATNTPNGTLTINSGDTLTITVGAGGIATNASLVNLNGAAGGNSSVVIHSSGATAALATGGRSDGGVQTGRGDVGDTITFSEGASSTIPITRSVNWTVGGSAAASPTGNGGPGGYTRIGGNPALPMAGCGGGGVGGAFGQATSSGGGPGGTPGLPGGGYGGAADTASVSPGSAGYTVSIGAPWPGYFGSGGGAGAGGANNTTLAPGGSASGSGPGASSAATICGAGLVDQSFGANGAVGLLFTAAGGHQTISVFISAGSYSVVVP